MYHRHARALCIHRRDLSPRRDLIALDRPPRRRMVPTEAPSRLTELVRASADGDETAWNELVRRYASW